MLNLSDNPVEEEGFEQYDSLSEVEDHGRPVKKLRILLIVVGVLFAGLFLPWTQNIRVKGKLTTLYPEQRPQTVQNIIPGRIAKWYVREGQLVQAGDTIIQITEVKDEYFDPALIERTQTQIDARKAAAENNREKAEALADQIVALENNLRNKVDQAINKFEQSRLKFVSDSVDLEAAKIDFNIATARLERMEELYEQGLKSLTDLESRRLKLQEMQAKLVSAENKWEMSRNSVRNAEIEMDAVENDYREKLGKARSDRNEALASYHKALGDIAKMENQLSNYQVRQDNYIITAPLTGYVTQAISVGIGETIKEGTRIVSIMPEWYDLAVEMYVAPVDFPLLEISNDVRIIFDGWPAIVFSGWPQLSNGTFGGEILAIDNFISPNGRYRILVVPDEEEEKWPEELRVGSGADGILLFKDVPLWYELWRQLNGFPPDYYRQVNGGSGNMNAEKK